MRPVSPGRHPSGAGFRHPASSVESRSRRWPHHGTRRHRRRRIRRRRCRWSVWLMRTVVAAIGVDGVPRGGGRGTGGAEARRVERRYTRSDRHVGQGGCHRLVEGRGRGVVDGGLSAGAAGTRRSRRGALDLHRLAGDGGDGTEGPRRGGGPGRRRRGWSGWFRWLRTFRYCRRPAPAPRCRVRPTRPIVGHRLRRCAGSTGPSSMARCGSW